MIVSNEQYTDNPSWNIISKLFNLSKKEFVYDDFSCSLWNKIAIPGHLYCMENHICFYAEMMGTESKVIIAMSDIEELNKKNSLGFIKNAIEIVCKNKKSYYFTGFGDREGVFDLISGIWKGGAPNKPKPKITDESIAKVNDEASKASIIVAKSEDNKPKDQQVEQPGKELQDDEIKEIVILPTSKDGDSIEFLKLRLPVSIDKFFELFLADDAVFDSKERLALQNAYDIVVAPWKLDEENNGLHTRDIDFMIKVTDIPFGNPVTRVHCVQTYKKTDNLLEVIRISQSLDVPYGTSFKLEEKWTLEPFENSTTKTSFTSTGKVNFIKSTMLSKTIKSRSLKEMQKDQDLWFKTLRERKLIEETPPSAINRKGRELNHEIEKSEESKLNRDGLYDSRLRKDIGKIGKVEDQLVALKKGLKLFGVLLLTTIFLFLLSLFLLNRKISALQDRIHYLENK